MLRNAGLRKSVEQPVLDLNFAAAGALDSRITFSRGTSATFVGSNGLIQSAGNNVARFDHDPVTNTPQGLLIEEARTNLAPNSHEFNNNSGTTRSQDAQTAPDGATTADEFTISSSNESHQITNVGLSASDVTTGTVHAVSFFAKLINGTPNIGVRGFGKGGFNAFPIFDLNAGTVVNVGSSWESGTAIESFGNGWFRCKCVVNPSSQFAPLIHLLASGDTTGSTTFTGNGTDKIAIWGGQLEVGSFVTSHIATSGSTATRNADVATMGPTNSKPFDEYNPSEGTAVCEFKCVSFNNKGPFHFSTGTTARGWGIRVTSSTATGFDAITRDADGYNNTALSSSINLKNFTKTVASINSSGHVIVGGDGQSNSDTAETISLPVDRLFIGTQVIGGSNTGTMSGHIRRLKYFPRFVTALEAKNLTSD